jgi:hypothetical protein
LTAADMDLSGDIAAARKVLLASVGLFKEWGASDASAGEIPITIVEEQSRLTRLVIEDLVGTGTSLNQTRRTAFSDQPAVLVALLQARAALEANRVRTESQTTVGLPAGNVQPAPGFGPDFTRPLVPGMRFPTLAIGNKSREELLEELQSVYGVNG